MEHTVRLLTIDLRSVSSAARDAFAMSLDEQTTLSLKARDAGQDIEVFVLADDERFEIYTTEVARQTVYRTLLGTIAARMPSDDRGSVRTTEVTGVAAAWHLMHLMVGTPSRSGVRKLTALNEAALRAKTAGTLGPELSALFEHASNAGWRIQSETALGDDRCSHAERELDSFEADRIIEEELVTWQAARARQGSLQSIRPSRLDPSYYTASEAGSSVRVKPSRLGNVVPFAKPAARAG